MTVERTGSKQECFNLVEEIKGMDYEIISYSLAPVNPSKPEGNWTITVTYRNKINV